MALRALNFRHPARACALALAATLALAPTTGGARANPQQGAIETVARFADEPIMAIVSIGAQTITVYDADGWTHRAPISSGMRGHETPAGIFAVVQKNADHRSNLYDDAWMPHMQRLTWNGIALHGGVLPGHPASRGCVRMPFEFAEKLFGRTNIGMRVIVAQHDAGPVDFAHPALSELDTRVAAAAIATAKARRREAAEATSADTEARRAAATASRDAALLNAAIRRIEWRKTRAEADLARAVETLGAATTDEDRARAEGARLKAAAGVAEAEGQIATSMTELKAKLDAKEDAAAAAATAAARRVEAVQVADDARLAIEPVSVYVSRAAQMLYVRRNTRKPLPEGGERFDAPVEIPIAIRDPEKPIGTHVFTAVALAEAGLRWTAVTIDEGNGAKDALDRIAIPREVLDHLASSAVPRSSIVISDEPLSGETNYRTEFVAVMSNQPQGGFVTRRPTIAAPAGSRNSWGGGAYFGDRGFRGGWR